MNARGKIVYVLRDTDRIKIGCTNSTLERRLRLVRREARGEVFELLGSIRGSFHDERSVHRLLREYRYNGYGSSWYRPSPQVLSFVKILLSPGFSWKGCPQLRAHADRYNTAGCIKAIWREPVNEGSDRNVSTICRENFMTIARTYAMATDRTLNQVSKEFYGNIGFIVKFRAKKQSVSLDKFDEMIQKFRDKWPADIRWPPLRVIVIPGPAKKIIPTSLVQDRENRLPPRHAEASGKRRRS